jgi:type I restriction enzyme, R subunit
MLVYVNNVIKGKLMESDLLQQQAAKNSKSQFANSPDLDKELMNAITDAVSTHSTMSKQALDPVKVRQGLNAILAAACGLVGGVAGSATAPKPRAQSCGQLQG